MPNNTANNFVIHGPVADINRFISAVKTAETDIDFNGVSPIPEDLKGVTSPVRIVTQEEIDNAWVEWNKRKEAGTLDSHEKERPWGLGITQAKHDELVTKYGVSNWYDWCITNWGTKWNAYDAREWSVTEQGDGSADATLYYETAWSPATALWMCVSKDYPTIQFYHEFADEGGSFLGSETIVNGEIINEEVLEWDSDDGIELREGLGRYWPENEENEVEA